MSFKDLLKNSPLAMALNTMEIRYRIIDFNKNIIFCNLHAKETDKINRVCAVSQKFDGSNVRAGVVSNKHGTVIAFTSNKDFLKSSAKFSTTINVILNSVEMINGIVEGARDSVNKSTSRLVHNLTSLNAHNIQEIYSLVPQEKVSKKMGKQISFVESIVKQCPKDTALLILRVAKNNAAMKVEFSVYRKLFDSNPDLLIREHNVHKVLMNVFYLFFPDFTDKNVKVVVGDDKNKYMAYFDYESFHVALYHIVENASKYIKPSTSLVVNIKSTSSSIEIVMDMVSLEIKKGEADRIFEEGFSGDLAFRMGKSGDGIGMNLAKKILELNYGSVSVVPHNETSELHMGISYQKNVFTINVPKKKKA